MPSPEPGRDFRVVGGSDYHAAGLLQSSEQPVRPAVGGAGPPFSSNVSHKLAAKRINESLKLFCSLLNTLGAGLIGAASIIPFVQNRAATLDAENLQWCLIGVLLPLVGHLLLHLFLQSEE